MIDLGPVKFVAFQEQTAFKNKHKSTLLKFNHNYQLLTSNESIVGHFQSPNGSGTFPRYQSGNGFICTDSHSCQSFSSFFQSKTELLSLGTEANETQFLIFYWIRFKIISLKKQ